MAWLWSFCLAVSLSLSAQAKDANDIVFPKKKLTIGGQTLTVEVASNEAQHSRGLMFRKSLPEGTGMIFIFSEEKPLSFWMKNTLIDLSIGFFDAKKKLIDIQDMKAVKTVLESQIPSYPSAGPAQYALEVPKGWFAKKKIKIGDHFTLD